MPETAAAQVFLFVASICVVILTALACIIGVYLIRLVIEARSLVRKVRMEAERISHARKACHAAARIVGAWVRGGMR